MKNLKTSRYDITGNSFFRVLRFSLLNKLAPTGNYRLGTGLRPGLTLLFLHWFGRPLFRLLIHFEPRLHRLYLKLKR
ncbi:MAG: hypothetical protein KJO60_09750 [Desulfofustis sp.]|nr:hypothetical protein [Desulfofustis sp.]MBT8344888.1 hypothetical protein [Desulfofustis sp.]MBT8354796.1 hypothetical protein [Desulfofustis sp.]NNF47867.1 hypothetical protein [Desulfofustis sp.]NNK58319.1 hypothetical protein [Desulfofustis sp.]